MKSLIAKRSVVINGRKSSICLEDQFWDAVREIARERQQGVGELITSIDTKRHHANLSSTIRLFVLDYYRHQVKTSDHIRDKFLSRGLRNLPM